jgi:hypothetical protein
MRIFLDVSVFVRFFEIFFTSVDELSFSESSYLQGSLDSAMPPLFQSRVRIISSQAS